MRRSAFPRHFRRLSRGGRELLPRSPRGDPRLFALPTERQPRPRSAADAELEACYGSSNFTIEPGKETWFYAIAKHAMSGCASFLLAPDYNLSAPIRIGGNWPGPIQNPRRDFEITCSIGGLRAQVHVKQG